MAGVTCNVLVHQQHSSSSTQHSAYSAAQKSLSIFQDVLGCALVSYQPKLSSRWPAPCRAPSDSIMHSHRTLLPIFIIIDVAIDLSMTTRVCVCNTAVYTSVVQILSYRHILVVQ